MAYTNTDSLAMEWDDVIEKDGQEVVYLEDGDYTFVVTEFERARHNGSAKLPPCNKAALTLAVETPNGTATVWENIFLYRTQEWKLSAFFRCIGAKKTGEKVAMDWNKVLGAKGRAHFHSEKYTNNNGEEKTKNVLDRYYDYSAKFFNEPEWVKEAQQAESWEQGTF